MADGLRAPARQRHPQDGRPRRARRRSVSKQHVGALRAHGSGATRRECSARPTPTDRGGKELWFERRLDSWKRRKSVSKRTSEQLVFYGLRSLLRRRDDFYEGGDVTLAPKVKDVVKTRN